MKVNRKSKYYLCFYCMIFLFIIFLCLLMLTGCSYTSSLMEKEPIENTAFLKVGRHFEVNNTNESLILYDYKEALAGDGLYYASWRIGDAKPYENSDGDTVNLYDAQLYLLLGEFTSAEKAQDNQDTWLEAGKANYEISDEKNVTCNGQTYLMITYTFKNKDNPYVRGVSAFTVHEKHAICAELTCQENFNEDLESILTGFLENCTYK